MKWSDPWNKNIRREIYHIVYNFVHGTKTEVYTSDVFLKMESHRETRVL